MGTNEMKNNGSDRSRVRIGLNRREFIKGAFATGALLATGSGLLACASAKSGEAAVDESVSGIFEGVGFGMQGEVKVALHVENGRITELEILESKETPYVAGVALERIPAQIVEHQTLSVDTVTGATLCSMALMTAATEAAKQSGLDMNVLSANAYTATPGPDEVWDTEVLVVGGGGAAFSAAISAAEAGSKVIMIEKGSVLGGNTMMAGSAFNAVDPEVQSLVLLAESQKKALDGYLVLTPDDPTLKFDQFPEWSEVLSTLQGEIQAFYAEHADKTVGVDMPSFDTVALHMWHTYTGGLREMNDGTWVASDINLVKGLTENALDSFVWMDSLGLECEYGANATESLYTVVGAMWRRTHEFLHGAERISQLRSYAEGVGVEIHTETAGKELVMSGQRVTGLIAQRYDGTNITIDTSKGVVLACGGYSANAEMVIQYDKYWGDDLSTGTLTTNLGTNEGDGVVMAEGIGAALTGLEVAQMLPLCSPTKGTLTDGAFEDAADMIWIDKTGNRFVDEYAGRDVLSKAAMKLEDSIFYIIFAGTSNEEGITPGARPDDLTYFGDRIGDLVDAGHIWYGETLAELAAASGENAAEGVMPAFTEEALRTTIEKYNSYFENQSDPDFGKSNISGYIDLDFIENTPGVGICISPRKPSLHHTMGGIVIDTDTRVLDAEGKPFEGLYAAGEVTGGIHAGNRLGGNAIADIFTFGHLAGTNIAHA